MFTINRDALYSVLQKVVAIVQAQQTMPILSYLMLDIRGSQLKLYATDLEIELVGLVRLEKDVEAPVKVMLSARKLLDICKSLTPGSILKFTAKDSRVVVASSRSRFTLSTMPVEEFSQFSKVDEQWEIKINQKSLLKLLKSTSFAMGSQDVRYYLNGLLLELHENAVRAVSTDGHRLAFNSVSAKINTEHKAQVIVPNKAIIELIRLLDAQDTDVIIRLSMSQLCYSSPGLIFNTKLIDARFPNYECALPIGLDKKVTLKKDEFAQTISRVSILSNQKIRGVRLELQQGVMQISAANQYQEVAVEDFNIDYQGPKIDIAFNVRYLLEAVQNCSSDNIELHFKDTSTSILIKEHGIDSQVMFVLMPLCLYQNVASEYSSN